MKTNHTNWYLAKLVYHIHIDNGKNQSQFDEQYRLISSVSHDDAYFKARTLGKDGECEFQNSQNQKVKWKFIDVPELQHLNELKHGTELYSNTQEVDDINSYLDVIRRKALIIQSESGMFI